MTESVAVEQRSSAFFEAYESSTTRLSSGGGINADRLEMSFVIDSGTIGNGVFPSDFRLTLVALTPGQEVTAARAAAGDQYVAVLNMAKAALNKVDGKSLKAGEKEFLWDRLGPNGRNLVMLMYQDVLNPSEDAKKKAQETLTIG